MSMSFILLRDDFNGVSLDQTKWSLPEPGPSSFIGRTQFRLDEAPTVQDGSVYLQLDTFNPRNPVLQPGEVPSLFGSEIITNENFSLGIGVAFEARMRIVEPVQRGIVAGFFTFTIRDGNGDGQITNIDPHDELTFEILTNDIDNALQNPNLDQIILTNAYEDDPLGPGDAEFISIEGLDLTEFNTFRIVWFPDKVEWFVNDELIREEFDTVPNEAMNLHLNLWAPAPEFPQAYDDSLQPVFRAEDNETFFFQVDYVQVEQFATLVLLQNEQANWSGIWSMDGANPFDWHPLPSTNGATIAGFINFNQDIQKDILLQNKEADWSGIWTMDGANPVGWDPLPSTNGATIIGAADFNRDGKPDILLQNKEANWSGIWTMDGANPVGWDPLPSTNGATIIGAADFNRDGKPDILLQNKEANWSGIWTMDGANPVGWDPLPSTSGAMLIV